VSIFQPFPKLARLSRGCVITEKLDGTNAQIYIVDPDTLEGEEYEDVAQTEPVLTVGSKHIYVGSRTRLITPGKKTDNYGFAQWVSDHPDLVELGEGRHFGEWYGNGIQRSYGLPEKRFALFDTSRWPAERPRPSCVEVVPVLHHGEFSTSVIEDVMYRLSRDGSKAVPGFMNPEGIVVYHQASRTQFKKTFDDKHKEAA
jgi:hypothetical protein